MPAVRAFKLVGNKIVDIKGNTIVARGPEDVVASAARRGHPSKRQQWAPMPMRMLFTLDSANGMTPAGFDSLLAAAVSHHMLVWVSLIPGIQPPTTLLPARSAAATSIRSRLRQA